MSSAIEVRGLIKRFETLTAVNGIDLTIEKGECFGLLGPNGAGKTTTVEILEGLTAPTSGEVRVLGSLWGVDDETLRQRLGVALQETQLADKLTVLETLKLFRSFYKNGRTVDEVIASVGLEEKRNVWVSKLSGGQKQRLAIACALVGNPDILFLDEPTTGLDPQSRRQVWDLVDEYKRQGRTVLLTTHYMDEAEKLCDRVAIIDHGKIISLGTPRALIEQLGGSQVIEFATEPPVSREWIEKSEGLSAAHFHGGAWTLTVNALHQSLPPLLDALKASGVTLNKLTTHQATLEDVFVSLTGRKLRDN
jgi:ABC-2 type transport system ATP-binding protein